MSIIVFIEVSSNTNIKYEHDHKTGRLICDRILHTPMTYPYNYGYIPETLAGDGDPLDVMVVTSYKLLPGSYVECKILGVLYTEDEKGKDEKIIAVPISKIDPYMKSINQLSDLKQSQLDMIHFFFENYKSLEKDKWVKVSGWGSREEAEAVYEASKK
jgi:inorganic pyrophosphatase